MPLYILIALQINIAPTFGVAALVDNLKASGVSNEDYNGGFAVIVVGCGDDLLSGGNGAGLFQFRRLTLATQIPSGTSPVVKARLSFLTLKSC